MCTLWLRATDPVVVHEDSAPILALSLAWKGLRPGLSVEVRGFLELGLGLGFGLEGQGEC